MNDDDEEFRTQRASAARLRRLFERKEGQESAYIIVISGPGVGEMHRLPPGLTTIGRGKNAGIQIEDTEISRLHLKLENRGDTVRAQDNESTNGTFVNGHQVEACELEDGDKIQLGTTTILKLSYHDDLDEAFQRKMYKLALRDGLTGAFNKRYFTDRLDGEIAYSRRHSTPLSLILFDLDHFKHINDSHGHLAGDYVLATFAERTSSMIRREDVFARFGGEEFAVISRGLDGPAGFAFAERIRKMVREYAFSHEQVSIPVTVSVGLVAMSDVPEPSSESLIAAADEALYAAKHAGRDRTMRFTP